MGIMRQCLDKNSNNKYKRMDGRAFTLKQCKYSWGEKSRQRK